MKIAKFFKDPLFQFLLIGIVIYALYFAFGINSDEENENTIVVSSGEVAWMKDSWSKKMNRPPTQEELDAMINSNIEETALYNEAIKMGLDKDDIIIRRRLSQKLRFLQEDLLQPTEPSDEELQNYFEESIDKYYSDLSFTMTQIFFDPDKREEATLIDAEKTKKELMLIDINTINPNDYGDRFMLQSYYPDRTQLEIAKLFGSEFAKSVSQLDTGKWHGPILSGYGTHLVYISTRIDPPSPVLENVKERVMADWKVYKQKEINRLYIESVLSRYTIIIEEDNSSKVLPSAKTNAG
jgi:hypothetical protein